MNWGPLHSVVVWAVLSLCGLIALAHYDGTVYRDSLPDAYRYLPPHSLAHAYSTNFGRSWSTIASHKRLTRFALRVSEIGNSFEDNIYLRLRERCMTDDVVRNYGINPDGEILYGIFSYLRGSFGDQLGQLAVLPVLDRDTFLRHMPYFVPYWENSGVKITVTGTEEDANPVAFRIHRSDSAGEGTLCDDLSGTVIRSQPKRLNLINEGVNLVFLPRNAVGQLSIECKAIYASGAEGKCRCSTSNSTLSCDKVSDNIFDEQPEKPDFANPTMVLGDGIPVAQIGSVFIAFPNEKTAVVANNSRLMELSLKDQERNALHFFNDADIRRLGQLESDQSVSSPRILEGVLRLPNFLGRGASVFSFRGDESNIEGKIHITLDDLKLAVLQKLFTATQATADPLAEVGPGKVEFHLRDEDADHYLRFMRDYWPNKEKLDEMAGGFAPLLELLVGAGFTHLQGHVVDIRHGVPTWLLGARIGNRDRALQAVRDMQETFRKTRDIDVLTEALLTARRGSDEKTQNIESVAALSKKLAAETHSTWDQYTLTDEEFVFRKDGKLPDVLFSGARQELNDRVYTYYYVTPQITDNDLKYRINMKISSDEEKDRIESDDSRMVAFHDDEEGVLWFGTDRETVKWALEKATGAVEHSQTKADAVRAPSFRSQPNKAIFRVNPTWVNTQIFRYPGEIRSMIGWYMRLLDGYQRVEILLSPGGSSDDLLTMIRLTR